MIKAIAAFSLALAFVCATAVWPDRTDATPASVPQRALKGDRLPVRAVEPPHQDVDCLEDSTEPVHRPQLTRDVRIAAVDRRPPTLSPSPVRS